MFNRFTTSLFIVATWAAPPLAAGQDIQAPVVSSMLSSSAARITDQLADRQAATPSRELPDDRSWTTPVLVSLQVATVVTQMLDAHSTYKVLDNGGSEVNPIIGGLVDNRAAFVGVKVGISAGVIYVTHRIARDNKIAAIVASAAINSALLMVARHNYGVAQRLR